MSPTYSCTLKIVEEVDGETGMKLKHSYVTNEHFQAVTFLSRVGRLKIRGR